MNNIENRKYEKLIEDLYQDIEVPDSTPSWNALQGRLNRRKRRKKLSNQIKIITGVVCASIIISILYFGENVPQRAYAHVSDFFNNVVQIFLKKPIDNPDSALTLPPPAFQDQNSEIRSPEKVSLDEAKQKLSFNLLLPIDLPSQLQLNEIRIFKEMDGDYRAAYLEYFDSADNLIKINQRLISDNSSIMTEIREGAGSVKNIMIDEQYPAIVLEMPDGTLYIEWIVQDVKMLLSGQLSETEAIEFAKSFQP